MRKRLAFATLLLLLVATPAQAREFGANLGRAANNADSCQSLQPFQAVPSCTWFTSGSISGGRESHLVPASGIINRVRVKVGRVTGPMRVAIVRSLRREDQGEAACCIGQRQSGVFTPRRNAITTIRINPLRVSVSFNRRSRIYSFDSVALTMENRNTPIHAHLTGTGGGNCSGGWFPAVRPRQENFTGPYGVCGATILLRANWERR